MDLSHGELVKVLRQHTEALALPEGRRVGQLGHAIAEQYLLREMTDLDLEPFTDESYKIEYTLPHPNGQKPQKFTNLVGVIPGRNRDLPPILLGAHYDSVIDAPCADDNATSVAHNLVLARNYAEHPLERDIIIAFFDAEEPPFFLGETMGSRRFCEDYCSEIKFAAVIVTDLVGHDAEPADLGLPTAAKLAMPHIKDLVAVMGAESHEILPGIVEQAAGNAKKIRILAIPHEHIGPMSDHAAFADAGQPFLFLSCGQGRHYHTPNDTIEWVNFDKLAHITRFIAEIVDQIDTTQSPVEAKDFEIRLLHKALGRVAITAMKVAGIKIPKSSEEYGQFVANLVDGKLM